MPNPPDLVCVGHMVREMIIFPDREEGPVLGSPPAYCGLAAARQGTRTGIVSKIGPDMPQELLEPLRKAGIDLSGVIDAGRTTATELIYDSQGNKRIKYPAKADPVRPEDMPEAFRGARLVYICTMDNDVELPDIPAVTAMGQMSAVDLGGYGGVHMSLENRQKCPSLSELALKVSESFDIVKASDEDAVSIFGRDDPDASAASLLERGPRVVVVTAGSRGALVYTAEGKTEVPPVKARAIDTTGGGDTFMAGFLSEFLWSGDPVRAARWGCSTSACVIEKTGGVVLERMPTHAEVLARWQSGYSE